MKIKSDDTWSVEMSRKELAKMLGFDGKVVDALVFTDPKKSCVWFSVEGKRLKK